MKNEDLKKRKEKLSKLSRKEKELREKYLRKIATGEYYGPMEGYPTIDKPQLADYDEEKYFKPRPVETVAEAIVNNNYSIFNYTQY